MLVPRLAEYVVGAIGGGRFRLGVLWRAIDDGPHPLNLSRLHETAFHRAVIIGR
jgi:hypothetical protein